MSRAKQILATIWNKRHYSVVLVACLIILVGATYLAEQSTLRGLYAIVGGTVVLVGAVIDMRVRARKSVRHQGEQDNTS